MIISLNDKDVRIILHRYIIDKMDKHFHESNDVSGYFTAVNSSGEVVEIHEIKFTVICK